MDDCLLSVDDSCVFTTLLEEGGGEVRFRGNTAKYWHSHALAVPPSQLTVGYLDTAHDNLVWALIIFGDRFCRLFDFFSLQGNS